MSESSPRKHEMEPVNDCDCADPKRVCLTH